MEHVIKATCNTGGQLIAKSGSHLGLTFINKYEWECYDKDGNLKWKDVGYNTVFTEGANDLLDKYFKGSSYSAAFYVGLISDTSWSALADADTAAQLAGTNGWREGTPYSDSTRPALTLGTPSARSVNNSSSKAVFNINATATLKGSFVASISTKSGTTGFLYGGALFTGGDRAVQSGDTLNVTVTLSVS